MGRVTLEAIQELRQQKLPLVMLTAYDYPTARLVDEAGVHMILVGDSVGMVVHGFESTLPVTMEMMILHTQAARRGTRNALLIGDMPFMSYQASREEALRNAGRLLAEGGADAVKLEGGETVASTIRAMVEAGMAVQAHIGLTPQSVSAMGGFRVQGRSIEMARKLIADAEAVQQAGAFSVVIEGVPARLAALITKRLSIPTIGIGAGAGCDGQVLVFHDLLGLGFRTPAKFVKPYADLKPFISEALTRYRDEVSARDFPDADHSYSLPAEVWEAISSEFGDA